MSILKQGHTEIAGGDTCILTFPHNAARGDRIASSIKPGRPQ